MKYNGQSLCNGGSSSSGSSSGSNTGSSAPAASNIDLSGSCYKAPYDYQKVLGLSLLFFEAQRSGKLPGNQRVKWRKDSATNDKTPSGKDLTGGYNDGEDLKF